MSEGGTLAKVGAVLRAARERGVDRLDAHLLLGHVLARPRAWLLSHAEATLSAEQAREFATLVERRAAGEPFAYLVGEREFHGLTLAVNPAVLVPRPDTETLVDWALELLDGELSGVARPRAIDLGTGSGAVALALKAACARAEVWASDRSGAALAVARANAGKLSLDIRFLQGDWWTALAGDAADAVSPGGTPTFDLVVSNPPYIAADDPHLAALAHEPQEALVAADGGLADIAAIAAGARARMSAGGWLLFEHGWNQSPAVHARLAQAGFVDLAVRRDIEGRPRCTGGRSPRHSTAA